MLERTRIVPPENSGPGVQWDEIRPSEELATTSLGMRVQGSFQNGGSRSLSRGWVQDAKSSLSTDRRTARPSSRTSARTPACPSSRSRRRSASRPRSSSSRSCEWSRRRASRRPGSSGDDVLREVGRASGRGRTQPTSGTGRSASRPSPTFNARCGRGSAASAPARSGTARCAAGTGRRCATPRGRSSRTCPTTRGRGGRAGQGRKWRLGRRPRLDRVCQSLSGCDSRADRHLVWTLKPSAPPWTDFTQGSIHTGVTTLGLTCSRAPPRTGWALRRSGCVRAWVGTSPRRDECARRC